MTRSMGSQSGEGRPRLPWLAIGATLFLFGFGILYQWPNLRVAFPGFDDSGYLFDGVQLVEQGTLMPLGSGPLAGIVNGALFLFFPRDHMFLGDVSAIRRVILLIAVMAAAGISGNAIGGRRAGWAAMLLAAIARPVSTILINSADSLYAAFSGLSFAVLVTALLNEAQQKKTVRPLALLGAGLLLGLGALARLDGLLLGVILIPVLWLLRGRNRAAAREAMVFAAGFLTPVVLYLLSYGMITGSWDPQLGQRSYLAFEQGHNFLYTDRYEVIPDPSSANLYGTAEENGYSVFRAILRNPPAFLARIPLVAANAVRMYYNGYSTLGGVLFLFLVAGGAVALWVGSKRPVLWTSLVCCLPLLGYLLASYRPGFFGTIFVPLLFLAVAGSLPVVDLLRNLRQSNLSAPLLVVWGLVFLGFVGSQSQYGIGQFRDWAAARQAEDAYRGWLEELSAQIPRGQCMISYNSADAIYSNHSGYGDWMIFYEISTAQQLREEMQRTDCRYVVVDSEMQNLAPDFIPLVEGAAAEQYTSRDGSRKIYVLSP